eukprot:TRINITY_DN6039_c0_g1_i1.p1 TRINITY_DN6039_c0_g1~~TRINITY_DN6039_c0_g1_i1.p1  ORF type:complete len:123 (-),score=19.55 TRINITY_DN6039_c0_g1_i1:410-778(-)
MFYKLGKYDECILDCSMVIEMIQTVNPETMLKSNEIFKGFLRRAVAYKSQRRYNEAKVDLDEAIKIKPNDGAAKKLLYEIKIELKRKKFRKKLQHIGSNDKSLNDFDHVFNLSLQFLAEYNE